MRKEKEHVNKQQKKKQKMFVKHLYPPWKHPQKKINGNCK